MALPERAFLGQLTLELVGARTQCFVGQGFQLGFQRIDLVDARPIGADPTVVRGTEQLAGDSADHRIIPSNLGSSGRFGDNTIFPEIRSRSAWTVAVGVPRATQTQRAENTALFGR